MKTSDLSRYALSICVAGTFFAGCGGSPQTAFSPAGTSAKGATAGANLYIENAGDSMAPDTALSGEVFTASNVTVTTSTCGGEFKKAHFSASGKAKGPYPGTFSASGRWSDLTHLFHPRHWVFSQSFSITSGTRKIAGKIAGHGQGFPSFLGCKKFGPAPRAAGLKYYFDGGRHSGPVSIEDIVRGSLYERLW